MPFTLSHLCRLIKAYFMCGSLAKVPFCKCCLSVCYSGYTGNSGRIIYLLPVILKSLFFWLFCQLSYNMSPVVSLPYSHGTPNTWLASTEQFDLSHCVVIGDPGLVIHGSFDCWHVKCLVPLPKAEPWCAGSFVFSCLTSDPKTITGSWYTFKQQQMRLVHLAAGWGICVVPDLLVRSGKAWLYQWLFVFLQIYHSFWNLYVCVVLTRCSCS